MDRPFDAARRGEPGLGAVGARAGFVRTRLADRNTEAAVGLGRTGLGEAIEAQPAILARIGHGRAGQPHVARLGRGKHVGRGAHPVATDVVALDPHPADRDADAKGDAFAGGGVLVALGDIGLDLHGAAHRPHRIGEFGDPAVPECSHQASTARGEERVDQDAPIGVDARERADPIGLDQSLVVDDIHRLDRDHARLPLVCHQDLPATPTPPRRAAT